MNKTQAIIVMKNGVRKYGFILNNDGGSAIHFIPGTEQVMADNEYASALIEHIPVDHIVSIDTFLK